MSFISTKKSTSSLSRGLVSILIFAALTVTTHADDVVEEQEEETKPMYRDTTMESSPTGDVMLMQTDYKKFSFVTTHSEGHHRSHVGESSQDYHAFSVESLLSGIEDDNLVRELRRDLGGPLDVDDSGLLQSDSRGAPANVTVSLLRSAVDWFIPPVYQPVIGVGTGATVFTCGVLFGVWFGRRGSNKNQEGDASGDLSAESSSFSRIDRLLLRDTNKEFAANLELALRASAFACITAVPFLLPGFQGWMQNGYYSSGAVVMFIFTLYKSVGETVCFAIGGMLGTFLAVFNIWIMFGIFPAGVTPTSAPTVWWTGVIEGTAFVYMILWLNLNDLCRMFALSWHCYFWMTFLNPESNRFNNGFGLSLTGPAVSCLVQGAVGASLAVLASLLPYPIWAMDKARDTSLTVTNDLMNAWFDAVDCYTQGQVDKALLDRLRLDMDALHKDVLTLEGNVANAWYECLGVGRWQKARIFLSKLDHVLRESHDRLAALLYGIEKETRCGGGTSHLELMQELKPLLEKLSQESGKLMQQVTLFAGDGYLDTKEIGVTTTMKQNVRAAINELSVKLKAKSETSSDQELFDEYSFCLNFCACGRLAIEFADVLIEDNQEPVTKELSFFQTVFDRNELFRQGHLDYVVQNSTSILVAFFIGYHGHGNMLQRLNSGLAETVSLLLSAFVGSALSKNLTRVQGVVMGCVCGQIAYACLAWCSFWGYVNVAIWLFFWVLATAFTYYSSEESATLGCLLAAFGAKYMLQGCSDTTFEPGGTYYSIVNTVLGVIVMSVVDMILEPARASDLAVKDFTEMWKMYSKAFTKFFDPEVKNVRFHQGTITDMVKTAQMMGVEAYKEPRFWRTPWRNDLYQQAIHVAFKMRVNLAVMECSLSSTAKDGGPKSKALQNLLTQKSFQNVREAMLAKLASIEGMLKIFAHESDSVVENDPYTGPELQQVDQWDLADVMAELNRTTGLAGASKMDKVADGLKTLEDDTLCKISAITVMLDGQIAQLLNLENAIMSRCARPK